jgi:excisionase family DNA binding protein
VPDLIVRRWRISLLTRHEAAERLNVSFSTVRRLGAEGKITEVQVGKRAVRIDPESVEAHIRAGRRGGHGTGPVIPGENPP